MSETTTETVLPGEHGRISHYAKGCRHPQCKAVKSEANRASAARRRDTQTSGGEQAAPTPPEPLTASPESVEDYRRAAAALSEDAEVQKITAEQIAEIFDVPASLILPPETAAALAVAKPRPPAASVAGRVDSQGTVRRIRALHHLGYRAEHFATHLKVSPTTIWHLLLIPQPTVTLATHRRVVDLFKQLRVTPLEAAEGTDARQGIDAAKRLADDQGWSGPFEYDDIDQDPTPSHRRRKSHDLDTGEALAEDAAPFPHAEERLTSAEELITALEADNKRLTTEALEHKKALAGLDENNLRLTELNEQSNARVLELEATLEEGGGAPAHLAGLQAELKDSELVIDLLRRKNALAEGRDPDTDFPDSILVDLPGGRHAEGVVSLPGDLFWQR